MTVVIENVIAYHMTRVIVNLRSMESDAKARMIKAAADLIGARGMAATSFSDVLAESGAPRGSIYHHFPGGKAQLVEEVVDWVGEQVAAHQRAFAGKSARAALAHFFALWRGIAAASHGAAGCAVAGVAVDAAGADPRLKEAVRAAFRSWVELLAKQFAAAGLPAAQARAIATAAVAGMEGAFILCHAEGRARPLDTVAEQLLRLLPEADAAEP